VFTVLTACSSAAEPGAQGVIDQADKADVVAVKVALQDLVVAEGTYFGIHSAYTANVDALTNEVSYRQQEGVTISVVAANETTYCAEGTSTGAEGIWHIGADVPTATDGPCP